MPSQNSSGGKTSLGNITKRGDDYLRTLLIQGAKSAVNTAAIRNILKGARALNNNEPFPGERLLHRVLGKSYYAHVLPPLPENEETLRERAETELSALLGKGSQALVAASGWLARWSEGLRDRSK